MKSYQQLRRNPPFGLFAVLLFGVFALSFVWGVTAPEFNGRPLLAGLIASFSLGAGAACAEIATR